MWEIYWELILRKDIAIFSCTRLLPKRRNTASKRLNVVDISQFEQTNDHVLDKSSTGSYRGEYFIHKPVPWRKTKDHWYSCGAIHTADCSNKRLDYNVKVAICIEVSNGHRLPKRRSACITIRRSRNPWLLQGGVRRTICAAWPWGLCVRRVDWSRLAEAIPAFQYRQLPRRNSHKWLLQCSLDWVQMTLYYLFRQVSWILE